MFFIIYFKVYLRPFFLRRVLPLDFLRRLRDLPPTSVSFFGVSSGSSLFEPLSLFEPCTSKS